MTDILAPSPPLSVRLSPVPASSVGASLLQIGCRLGGLLVPGLVGRIATNAFVRSRAKGDRASFRTPLGAQTFDIAGNEDVSHGYLWKNRGPTVLLVHGWGSESSSMIGFVKPLLDAGFQVASFDAPAHGGSPGHMTTMMRFVEAVGAVIKSLGNVQVIIGHSLGSIAAVTAVAHADQSYARAIKRLVLIAAPESLSTVLERWSTYRQLPPAVIGKIYDRLHIQNGVPIGHFDISVQGAAIDAAMLVIHDKHDPIVPLADALRLMRSLKNVRFEQTSGFGHGRILSAAPVKQIIMRFVNDCNWNSQR